ncbi:MAG: DUF5606 domain-containing protein [Bacteroidia bacterium]|nr:DUF5606 domain-containing protein [Bacteroidia bacterium]
MEYNKLVAVAGLPGLYELINSKTDGAIVRSIDDKSTRFVSSRIHNFSQLESIEVFTTGDNVNLAEVFFAMEKNSGDLPDVKDEAAVKKYFQKTYPELDFEKVYNSDLKKMIKWFEALKKNNIEIKLPEEPINEPETEVEKEVVVEKKSVTSPDKKKPTKKEIVEEKKTVAKKSGTEKASKPASTKGGKKGK